MLAPARRGRVPGPFLLRTPCAVSAGGSHSWDTAPSTCAMSPLCRGASGKVSPGWLGTRSPSAVVLPLGNEPVLGVDREIRKYALRLQTTTRDEAGGARGRSLQGLRPPPARGWRSGRRVSRVCPRLSTGWGSPGGRSVARWWGNRILLKPPVWEALGRPRGCQSRGTWVLLH